MTGSPVIPQQLSPLESVYKKPADKRQCDPEVGEQARAAPNPGKGEEMSRRSRRSRRLDLMLRASDGRPVIVEVKAKPDPHPFYRFVQALMHVSQLANPAQRKRLASGHDSVPALWR